MARLAIFFMLFFVAQSRLGGQVVASANPFELLHRLPKTMGDTTKIGPTNPFDVVPHRAPGASKNAVQSATPAKSFFQKISLPRGQSTSKTFLFWSLVAAFGFLTFSIAANRSVVGKAWRAFLNENQLALAHREATGLTGSAPYFLLYANFLLNAGVFAFLITRYFRGDSFNNLPFLLLCVAGASTVFLFKHLLLSVVAWLYPVANEVRRYNFLVTVFNCVLGLFLVPFNFLIAFARDFEPFLVFWTLGVAVVFFGYRVLRASVIGLKFLATDQFHFLLYLCAVEIAPVLLLVKLAMLSAS